MRELKFIRKKQCSRCGQRYETVHKYGRVCKGCYLPTGNTNTQYHTFSERRTALLNILSKRLRY